MTDIPHDETDAELANTCARFLKMALTAAQAHAAIDQNPQLVDSIERLDEARPIVHALGSDLEIELLAPAADGSGTVQFFRLSANSSPAWTLHCWPRRSRVMQQVVKEIIMPRKEYAASDKSTRGLGGTHYPVASRPQSRGSWRARSRAKRGDAQGNAPL